MVCVFHAGVCICCENSVNALLIWKCVDACKNHLRSEANMRRNTQEKQSFGVSQDRPEMSSRGAVLLMACCCMLWRRCMFSSTVLSLSTYF